MAKKKKEAGGKQPELQEIIDKIEAYRKQLADNPKISSTRFSHMQTALHWAKQIVRDCYGAKMEVGAQAWVK
jgi:hypothetical protein